MDNLPIDSTSFVDRSADIAAIRQLISRARLVTLVGVPGVGKTRLALRVGAEQRRRFRDGVWLVELAALHDPALLVHTVAQAVGFRDACDADPLQLLLAYVRDRRMLLIWDNCEHLVTECAQLAGVLLSRGSRLHLLATSRHVLRVGGEHVWETGPLPLSCDGSPTARPIPSDVRDKINDGALPGAVELFRRRAASAVPTFELTPENTPVVAEVCRQLEGLPLAIELAAARLRTMSVQQLVVRLGDRFELLTAEPRGFSARHRTLRTTIDWSFKLCKPAEQILWARLSVFAGGFDLEAVEQVCTDGDIQLAHVLDLLTELIDKSLLCVEQHGGAARYEMLETLREYGREKLRAGDQHRWQQRHAQRYLRLAEQGEREWFHAPESRWLEWADREHSNLRAALQYLTSPRRAQSALQLAGALWFHWVFSGRVGEGQRWLGQALTLSDAATPARARALWASAVLASLEGNLQRAAQLGEQAARVADRAGARDIAARAMIRLGVVAIYRGDPASGERLLVEALGMLSDADRAIVASAHIGLGMARVGLGDLAGAAQHCARAETICRLHRDEVLLGEVLNLAARIDCLAGDPAQAAKHSRTAVLLRAGRPDPVTLATAVEQLAWITEASGDHELATFLFGAADQVWRTFGLTKLLQTPYFHHGRHQSLARVRQASTDPVFEADYQKGRQLPIEEIVGRILQTHPGTVIE